MALADELAYSTVTELAARIGRPELSRVEARSSGHSTAFRRR